MTTGVLLMSYGSPGSLDEVAPYLDDIRGGRPSSPEAVASLTDRYRAIGGRSPLLDITREQAGALAAQLGDGFVVDVGMKHWHPYVADGVRALAANGADRIVGLALAPHYSKISIGGYEDRLKAAGDEVAPGLPITMIQHWYEEPAFIAFAALTLRKALGDWDDAHVLFTAHSLPERIIAEGDPYLDQLLASAKLVADAAGVTSFEFAFQSASHTGEPWLGPDVLERLEALAATGGKRACVAPIGFTADHLEILFDVDVECVEAASRLGLELRRTASPNAAPGFIRALADVVGRVAQ